MVKRIESPPTESKPKFRLSGRRTLHMHEQHRRNREWRRQKKPRNGDGIQELASRQPDVAPIPQPKIPSIPKPTNRFHRFCFFHEKGYPSPAPYEGLKNDDVLPRPIEPVKTPITPPSTVSRRRQARSEPVSPPNPLRWASTSKKYGIPRPEIPRWPLRTSPPPLRFEYIGHPKLRVYKVKLPGFLIDGPLDAMVEAAENYVSSLPDGWSTHLFSLTKCDIACSDIPGISSYVKQISSYISRAMQVLYGCKKLVLDKNQPHILKYSAESGHTGVQLHSDACDLTANLSLSKPDNFVGGGTYIAELRRIVILKQGEILLHPGKLLHSGNPITAGTRYLLVTFAKFEDSKW